MSLELSQMYKEKYLVLKGGNPTVLRMQRERRERERKARELYNSPEEVEKRKVAEEKRKAALELFNSPAEKEKRQKAAIKFLLDEWTIDPLQEPFNMRRALLSLSIVTEKMSVNANKKQLNNYLQSNQEISDREKMIIKKILKEIDNCKKAMWWIKDECSTTFEEVGRNYKNILRIKGIDSFSSTLEDLRKQLNLSPNDPSINIDTDFVIQRIRFCLWAFPEKIV